MKKLNDILSKLSYFLVRVNLRKAELILLGVFISEFIFPHATLAQTLDINEAQAKTIMAEEILVNPANQDNADSTNSVEVAPAEPVKTPKRVMWVTVTAYSSTPDQTDDSPCLTANGYNVCVAGQENVVAANFLPFKTQVKLPEYFGDQTFTVQDRMNKRYTSRVDVWMKSREAAIKFGVRRLKVEVY